MMETEVVSGPTEIQLERLASLNRFNRLYVYTPLVFTILLIVGLVVWMFIAVINGETAAGARLFVSTLADIITILVLVPMLVIGGIVPAGAIAFVVYRQQKKAEVTETAVAPALQRLLWRIEDLLGRLQKTLDPLLTKLASVIIRGNAGANYVGWWFRPITRLLSGEQTDPEKTQEH